MERTKKGLIKAVLLISFVWGGFFAVSTNHAAADTPTPKAPIVWADADHSTAVDAAGNAYQALGYICSHTTTLTNSDGTQIAKDAQPDQSKTVKVAPDTETSRGNNATKDVPACTNTQATSAPSYAWVTSGDKPHYILIVSAYETVGGKKLGPFDAKTRPITQVYTGNPDYGIYVAKLQDNGSQNGQVLSNIAGVSVDTSKAGQIKPITTSGANGTDHEDNPTCEAGGFGLGWILCPVYNLVGDTSDWLFSNMVQPFLRTSPISTDSSDPSYKIWSTFRIYGNVFLVIALLVIVFGQSIGGGMVDAYTAKKALPRLLTAAILINLSIYIVAALVDITNILGEGIGKILTAPLGGAGAFNIAIGNIQGGAIAGLTAVGIAGTVTAIAFSGAIASAAAPFIALFIVLPAFVGIVLAFITLLLRKAIILALILVSPVAFALYCLPNTEKYFKQWWSLLTKTLLVYPIVILIFAVADILSVTVMRANNSANPGAPIISFVLQFLPLFLIPYAFRLAGGAIGKIHDTVTAYGKRGQERIKGNPNDARSLRNRTQYRMHSAIGVGRENRYAGLSERAKKAAPGSFRRRMYSGLARSVNYGNLEAERSEWNEQQDKLAASQYSQGGDNSIRALWAKQYSGQPEYERDNEGNMVEVARGNRQVGGWYSPYKDANGEFKEWSPSDVAKARSIVRGDPSKLQAYAKYELGKAADADQVGAFQDRFLDMANDYGWNEELANGVWAGVKFAHQQTRKELKYTAIGHGENGKLAFKPVDHFGFSRELTDAMRRGDFASFRDTTAKAALGGYRELSAKVANGTASENDRQAIKNYQDLADHLQASLFQGAKFDRNRLKDAEAANAAAAAAGGDNPEVVAPGYGLGASQRAEASWKQFVEEANRSNVTPTATPPGGAQI